MNKVGTLIAASLISMSSFGKVANTVTKAVEKNTTEVSAAMKGFSAKLSKANAADFIDFAGKKTSLKDTIKVANDTLAKDTSKIDVSFATEQSLKSMKKEIKRDINMPKSDKDSIMKVFKDKKLTDNEKKQIVVFKVINSEQNGLYGTGFFCENQIHKNIMKNGSDQAKKYLEGSTIEYQDTIDLSQYHKGLKIVAEPGEVHNYNFKNANPQTTIINDGGEINIGGEGLILYKGDKVILEDTAKLNINTKDIMMLGADIKGKDATLNISSNAIIDDSNIKVKSLSITPPKGQSVATGVISDSKIKADSLNLNVSEITDNAKYEPSLPSGEVLTKDSESITYPDIVAKNANIKADKMQGAVVDFKKGKVDVKESTANHYYMNAGKGYGKKHVNVEYGYGDLYTVRGKKGKGIANSKIDIGTEGFQKTNPALENNFVVDGERHSDMIVNMDKQPCSEQRVWNSDTTGGKIGGDPTKDFTTPCDEPVRRLKPTADTAKPFSVKDVTPEVPKKVIFESMFPEVFDTTALARKATASMNPMPNMPKTPAQFTLSDPKKNKANSSIWGNAARILKEETGKNPSEKQILKFTKQILKANNLTAAQARELSPETVIKLPAKANK